MRHSGLCSTNLARWLNPVPAPRGQRKPHCLPEMAHWLQKVCRWVLQPDEPALTS